MKLLTCAGGLLHPANVRFNNSKTRCVPGYGLKAQELEIQNKKKDLGIQRGNTPETVRAKVGKGKLSNYHPDDLDALLDKWCDEEYQIRHELNNSFV
jgi:hypothetical protein